MLHTNDPFVSSDIIGSHCGALVDGLSTNILEADGKQLVKVISYMIMKWDIVHKWLEQLDIWHHLLKNNKF